MPAASVGCATSIVATGSVQPARLIIPSPSSFAKGDCVAATVIFGAEAVMETTTAWSSDS